MRKASAMLKWVEYLCSLVLVELDDTSQRNVILRVYECQVLDKEQSDYVILLLFPYRDPAETCVEKGF